jgi:5'-deoxynucleotidase YfbR-like HD superfamily hydrolase
MAKEFFYQVMGEVMGPITGVELRERAAAGDVQMDTLVRIGGDGQWVHARRLKNLFDDSGRAIGHEEMLQALGHAAAEFREIPQQAPSRLVLSAIAFAARKHAGQLRKDQQTPYISHPLRVMTIVATSFGVDDPEVLAAAVLHDVIEDTTADYDDLYEQFGQRVAEYVVALTKDPRLPEEEREERYLQAIAAAPPVVQLCKLADAYDNVLSSTELTKKQQTKTLHKANDLLDKLEPNLPDDARHAFDLLRELIEQTSGGLIRHD